jgi:hypothetical protein
MLPTTSSATLFTQRPLASSDDSRPWRTGMRTAPGRLHPADRQWRADIHKQFFTGPDRPERVDENPSLVLDGLAVGRARVIEPARAVVHDSNDDEHKGTHVGSPSVK